MRKFIGFCAAVMMLAACNGNGSKGEQAPTDSVTVTIPDSTVYGLCTEGTSMNCVELTTNGNDTLRYIIYSDSIMSPVKGGMMTGDKLAVTAHMEGDDWVADRVINLTTLLGKWSSIDKNFEIQEGGSVKAVVTENNKYVSWEICNGRLVLAPDTFDIYELGADSLMLENNEGIFVYARINK